MDWQFLPLHCPPGLKHEAGRGMKQIDCPRSRAEEEQAPNHILDDCSSFLPAHVMAHVIPLVKQNELY